MKDAKIEDNNTLINNLTKDYKIISKELQNEINDDNLTQSEIDKLKVCAESVALNYWIWKGWVKGFTKTEVEKEAEIENWKMIMEKCDVKTKLNAPNGNSRL